jgi:transposase
MDMIGRIRHLHARKNKSEREISRMTGLSRNTVAKWLHGEVDGPPKYRRSEQPNKLTAFHDALRQALKADARRPKHERRTAKALYAEIRRAGYEGGYTRVTDFIRAWRQGEGQGSAGNAFVPLAFELGEAFQFDWSEEGMVIGGIYYRVQVSRVLLCASRAFWLVAYPSQGHEMLFDAHTRSFAALGGVARRGIYDNMKTAVDKVKKGKGRIVNERFATMCAHYLYDPDFCNVASGWEKGVVEKNVQDSRRRIWTCAAKIKFGSFTELNAWLSQRCRTLWDEVRHPEHTQFSVAEMLEHERAHLMPMPVPFDGYVEKPARVSSTCLVSVARLPLFGAVRAGGPDGQHAAVPGLRRHRGGRHHRGPPRAAEQRGRDPVRLAALHPAAAEEAWCAEERRTVRRHARAAAAATPRVAAQPGRRPGHGAGAGDRAQRRSGRGAGGHRSGTGERCTGQGQRGTRGQRAEPAQRATGTAHGGHAVESDHAAAGEHGALRQSSLGHRGQQCGRDHRGSRP